MQNKETSVKILKYVEEVITTVVHLSEATNLIETRSSLAVSAEFIKEIRSLRNVKIFDTSLEDYLEVKIAG